MVKLNKIYTRTGDGGTTGLVDGSRSAKHSPRIEAIGAVDEANSALGFAAVVLEDAARADVTRLQNDLFDLGADLATPGDDFAPGEMTLRMVPAQAEWLEGRIDTATAVLAPLTSFVLPGGTDAAARLHVARTVCRRAEREVLLAREEVEVNPLVLVYLNRLSDLLFILARAANAAEGRDEPLWKPGGSRA